MRVLRWAGRLWTGVLLVTVLLVGLLLGVRLLLPLPFLSARPALMSATPPAGATGVSPRARAMLGFNVPMNPRSVERALRITPSAQVALLWNDDYTTLTISPTASLQPESTYHVGIREEALSRMFRSLERPIDLSFRTAPAPAVVAVLPADGAADVALATPISIKFSRPIMPATALERPGVLPELQFDPPLTGTVTWLDQAHVLFRPAEPLRLGTRYRATLAASLSDLGGGQLGSAFSWSFSTSAPQVLSMAPVPGARSVAPRAPLVLTLSQPLDLDSVRANLVITPTNEGTLTAANLPNATQLITYTPAADWRPDTTYTVALAAGVAPAGGALALQEPARWSFTAAPRPAVIGRFPGEGQILPPGQDLRLIFNTPMDEQTLLAALSFTPPVSSIRVTARDVEARISADVRPTTTYTVTLPASLTDRNGVPLGQEYRIRFQTASAGPELVLPEAPQRIAQLLPGQSVGLLIRRINLSALNLDLYALDEATIVRMLAFREDEWSSFQPERYAQPLLRSWSMQLADPLNSPVEDRLPLVTAENTPLPPGAYYLRIRTPDGPRADLLVLISRTRLILQRISASALIWATDSISATPLGGLPVALYQDGGLIQRSTTDPNGLWRIDRSLGGALQTLVALAEGDRPGIASMVWNDSDVTALERYRVFLVTDRAAYLPGERVALAGFVRRTNAQTNTLPPARLPAVLTVRQIGAGDLIYRKTLEVGGGLIGDSFEIPAATPAGEYILSVALGDEVSHTTFVVRDEAAQPLRIGVSAPEQRPAGDDVPVAVEAYTPEGLPVAGAVVSWTLSAERVPYPALESYTVGDDELGDASPVARVGMGQTDADGRFGLIITDTVGGDVPLRYRVAVRVTELGGPSAVADSSFLVTPAQIYAAVRLPSRIMTVGLPGAVEVLAVTSDGQPVANAAIRIEIYRRTWVRDEPTDPDEPPQPVLRPRDTPVLTRNVVGDERGAARVPLTLNLGGEYRVIARAIDADGRRMSSATSLWVAQRGFRSWRAEPNDSVLLIADRPSYQPGDTAALLLTSPFAESTALVTRSSNGGLAGEVRTLRAGEPLTLTIRPEDAPAVDISVLLVSQRAGSESPGAAPAVSSFKFASATIPVPVAGRSITVTITSDQATYTPGATATLTVTTTDDRGTGVPADVILDVVGASGAPQRNPAEAFRVDTPPAVVTAQISGLPAAPVPALAPRPPLPIARAPEPLPAPGVSWNRALRTNSDGVLTLRIPLPAVALDLRAVAWAASGADRFGVAQSSLAITQPFRLEVDAPPFLRVGDEVELAGRIRNTGAISQELSVALTADGVTPQAGVSPARQLTLAPGATARVAWPVVVDETLRADLSFSVRASGSSQTLRITRPILPVGTLVYTTGGALTTGRLSQIFTLPEPARRGWGRLDLDLAPSSQALAETVVRSFGALPERSLLDEASLLLASTALSGTQPLMQVSLDRLIVAQNGDGGWGWWPRGPSRPFVTAVALEALAAADRAGLDVPADVVERGIAAAEATLAAQTTKADLRAQLGYALALHNRSDAALRTFAADARTLGPEGLAYALLTGSEDQAEPDRAVLSQLESLAVRAGETAHWPANADDMMFSTDVSATSLALLALERAQPDSDLIADARRWLVAARGSGTWPRAYESARALAALGAAEPLSAGAPGQYVVALNGTELLQGSSGTTITTTRSLTLTLDRLQERNELTILSSGAPLVLGYRVVSAATPPPEDSGIGLLREYLDPLTGQPVDLARLRAGQLVRVRLTAVADEPHHFVEIEDALPAGFTLVEADAGAQFEHVAQAIDHLTLSSAALAPGIYEYTYLLRAATPGRYTAPAPSARLPGGRVLGTGRAAVIAIIAEK